jgi:hypothetical protein
MILPVNSYFSVFLEDTMNTTALLFSFATLVTAIGIDGISTPVLAQVDVPPMDENVTMGMDETSPPMDENVTMGMDETSPPMDENVTMGMDESLPPMDENTMDENVTIEMNESLPPSG